MARAARPSRVHRDPQVAHAMLVRRGEAPGAHIHLDRRDKQPRRAERSIPLLPHGNELIFADPVMHVRWPVRSSATVVSQAK